MYMYFHVHGDTNLTTECFASAEGLVCTCMWQQWLTLCAGLDGPVGNVAGAFVSSAGPWEKRRGGGKGGGSVMHNTDNGTGQYSIIFYLSFAISRNLAHLTVFPACLPTGTG